MSSFKRYSVHPVCCCSVKIEKLALFFAFACVFGGCALFVFSSFHDAFQLGIFSIFYIGAGVAVLYAKYANRPYYCWIFLVVNGCSIIMTVLALSLVFGSAAIAAKVEYTSTKPVVENNSATADTDISSSSSSNSLSAGTSSSESESAEFLQWMVDDIYASVTGSVFLGRPPIVYAKSSVEKQIATTANNGGGGVSMHAVDKSASSSSAKSEVDKLELLFLLTVSVLSLALVVEAVVQGVVLHFYRFLMLKKREESEDTIGLSAARKFDFH